MEKNQLFCKVLSTVSAIAMAFAGGMPGSCVKAASCEIIVKACFPERIFGKDAKPLGADEYDCSADVLPKECVRAWKSVEETWRPLRDSGTLGFTNYEGLLAKMKEIPGMLELSTRYQSDVGCADSVAFLSFLYFINSLPGTSSFNKKGIIKGLISLRDRNELRDDRFIMIGFDGKMGSNLKGFFPKSGRR